MLLLASFASCLAGNIFVGANANGSVVIDAVEGQRVLVNGVDVLREIASLQNRVAALNTANSARLRMYAISDTVNERFDGSPPWRTIPKNLVNRLQPVAVVL